MNRNILLTILVALMFILIVSLYFIFRKEKYMYPGGAVYNPNGSKAQSGYMFTPNITNSLLQSSYSNLVVTDSGQITTTSPVPIGSILFWAGTSDNIPEGWSICDGKNGTPDLRSRFVIGASDSPLANSDLDYYPPYTIGGEEYHALTIEEMPSHTHGYSHPFGTSGAGYNGGGNALAGSGQTEPTGGDPNNNFLTLPHNNLPSYFSLIYIMKIA